MPDLHVVAVLKAKPGSEDVVRDALAALVTPTRAEAGCVSYALSQSAADPSTFVTEEVWTSQADLETHMQTPHIARALQVAAEALDGPPSIHPLIPVSV
jgi:quinol monooxygenase YgiN